MINCLKLFVVVIYCYHGDGSDGRHVCTKYHGHTHYYQATMYSTGSEAIPDISEVVYNTVRGRSPRMVLKTAEGISGIAEESRGLTYLYPRTVGKQEKAKLAVH